MTYDELIDAVYTLTNRPDLVSETALAVKSATLKAHQSDYYSRDIHETGIQFPTADYIQSADYISLVSNFRSLKYIRRVEDANDTAGTFLQVVSPEEILDAYGDSVTDIAYVAGRILQIRSAVEFKYALMGCYVLPIVRTGAYSSWVASMFPDVIIYEAARVIFKTIGFDEQAAVYERLVAEQYQLLKMSALSDVGY